MGRKQLLLDLILKKNNDDTETSSDEEMEMPGNVDSDESETDVVLQKALASGKLKPGLHTLARNPGFKPKVINDVKGLKVYC